MNRKVVFFLAIVGFAIAGEEDVLELTDKDFADRIADIDATLVMFYDRWSEDYKEMKPEFAKAGKLLRAYPNIALAKVDCKEGGKDTCTEFEILDYPSLKIFRKGTVGRDYNGPNVAVGIAKYMAAKFGPVSKNLQTLDDIEEFLKVQETTIIGFFENETELKTIFLRYADQFKDEFRFGHSGAAEVISKYSETNGIVLFRAPQYHNKFEPSFASFKGDSMDDLVAFVKENHHGLVGYRTHESVQDFKTPRVIAYYSVDYANNPKGTNYWRNRILKVAKEFRGDFAFAISNKYDFEQEVKQYSFDYYDEKPLIVAHDIDDQKYMMHAEFSIENMQQFLSDLKDRKLKPFVKSEDIPQNNDKPVKVAVAKNFDEIVINNGKDTFILFYSPWCDHCEKMAPAYYELGMEMAEEDVEIVKFDCTANDIPRQFPVTSYPMVFWLPKGAKSKPTRYDGELTLDNFIKYISVQATNELKKYKRDGQVKKIEL